MGVDNLRVCQWSEALYKMLINWFNAVLHGLLSIIITKYWFALSTQCMKANTYIALVCKALKLMIIRATFRLAMPAKECMSNTVPAV